MKALESLQVLIVDDNRQARLLVRSLLMALGVRRCEEAGTVAEAMEVLRAGWIDLVLTDLAMRPEDGISFARRLRLAEDSPNPYVAIIMMTGYAERSRVAAARDAGVNSFLAKPISARSVVEHLLAAINDTRAFVRAASFAGPDRRRMHDPNFKGPFRRAMDSGGEDLDLDFPTPLAASR